MTSCHYCAEVGASNRKNHFLCPFCGRGLANYLPTPEQIQAGAHQIRYENEERRLRHPERAESYLPWERSTVMLTTIQTTTVHTDWDLYCHIMNGWKVVDQAPNGEVAWWKLDRVQLTDAGRAAITSPTPPADGPSAQ